MQSDHVEGPNEPAREATSNEDIHEEHSCRNPENQEQEPAQSSRERRGREEASEPERRAYKRIRREQPHSTGVRREREDMDDGECPERSRMRLDLCELKVPETLFFTSSCETKQEKQKVSGDYVDIAEMFFPPRVAHRARMLNLKGG